MGALPVEGRRLDPTGAVWQQTPSRGERFVGEIHTSSAGRFTLVMCGRAVAKGEKDPEAIRALALSWQPEQPADLAVYQHITTGRPA